MVKADPNRVVFVRMMLVFYWLDGNLGNLYFRADHIELGLRNVIVEVNLALGSLDFWSAALDRSLHLPV